MLARLSEQLINIRQSQHPGFDDFVSIFREWPSLSLRERAEFCHSRVSLVRAVAGTYFSDGHTLTTSGHSTGAVKQYRWGPSFKPALDFTLASFTGGVTRDRKAKLHVLPAHSLPLCAESSPGLYAFHLSTADLVNTATQAFRHFAKGRTCWVLMPAYAQALIDHAPQVFDDVDPARNFFEATGEPSTRAMRQFFKDRGLLYLDTMRSWMGGVTFITCKHGNQHFLDFMSEIKTEAAGEFQEIVTTDLWNLAQPFINFPTGDIVDWTRREVCACGYPIDDFEFQPRNPSVIAHGRPMLFIDMAAVIERQCRELLGLQKICVSFCMDRNVMFVDLVVNGTLKGVDVSPLERAFGDCIGLRCMVQERLSASVYKVKAVRAPDLR